jgi:hypothetical protein
MAMRQMSQLEAEVSQVEAEIGSIELFDESKQLVADDPH